MATLLPWEIGSEKDPVFQQTVRAARDRQRAYDQKYNEAERAAAAENAIYFDAPAGRPDGIPDFLESLFPQRKVRSAAEAPWLYADAGAPAVAPPPAPVPSSRQRPLRRDVAAAVPLKDKIPEPPAAVTADVAPPPPSAPPILERNPSAADVRSRLGFSWGKGVDVDPATGRPRRAGTFNLSPELTYGSRTGGETRPGPGGGFIIADPSGAELSDIITKTALEQARRGQERSQVTGKPAQATAGEMLEDERRNAYKARLQEDRNTALGLAQARLAAGEYTPEQYAEAVAAVERAYAMDAGVDPRFFSQPSF